MQDHPCFTDRICDGGHIAAKRASAAVRQQREITPPPDSSAPQNPNGGQMARKSGPAYTTGDKNMTNTTAANGKEAAYFGVPAEDDYGYAQAIKIGNTIHVSGQLSQDDKGTMIAPAALDESGKPADFSTMEEQMRVTYANAAKLLARFGATLDHVVEETLYVLDVDAAFAVAGKVRKEAYATARPQCASNLIGVSRLAFPEQLIEIVFKAVLPPA
jgi:enamine deaminase RidA (YjgF/YER057c/UK114 family)